MNQWAELATFVHAARSANLDARTRTRTQMKVRLLDTLGAAIAALPVQQVQPSTASDGAADVAAHWSALASQLDLQDVYLTAGGVRHPADNMAAILAAAADANASGADLLTALATAYTVETQLADAGSNMAGDAALRAGLGSVLNLASEPLATLLAAAPAAGEQSGADGVAARARAAVLAAQHAVHGAAPAAPSAHEGGERATVDWSRSTLDGVLRTSVRPYAASVYAQSAIDVALTISMPPLFRRDAVREVRVKTFQAAFDAMGSDADPSQRRVESTAQARCSMAYAIAVALLDRKVGLAQFTPQRIRRGDVQSLLRKVRFIPVPAFTARFPGEVRAQIEVGFNDGSWYCTSATSFHGFTLQPMDWHGASEKYTQLAAPVIGDYAAALIRRCVEDLDTRPAHDLLALLDGAERKAARDAAVQAA